MFHLCLHYMLKMYEHIIIYKNKVIIFTCLIAINFGCSMFVQLSMYVLVHITCVAITEYILRVGIPCHWTVKQFFKYIWLLSYHDKISSYFTMFVYILNRNVKINFWHILAPQNTLSCGLYFNSVIFHFVFDAKWKCHQRRDCPSSYNYG